MHCGSHSFQMQYGLFPAWISRPLSQQCWHWSLALSGVLTIQHWSNSGTVGIIFSPGLLGYQDLNQKFIHNVFMALLLIFIDSFSTDLHFISICGNWEPTPANQFQFIFRYFWFVFFSLWYRQEEGRERRKQEENGREERWGEPKSSMSFDYGINPTAIALQSNKL